MKRLAFAIGVSALAFAATTPARADFAVVRFADGYCRIWWDSTTNPLGDEWQKIAIGLPDWDTAWRALSAAIADRACR